MPRAAARERRSKAADSTPTASSRVVRECAGLVLLGAPGLLGFLGALVTGGPLGVVLVLGAWTLATAAAGVGMLGIATALVERRRENLALVAEAR